MNYRKNLVTGVSLALFSIVYLYFSSAITIFTGSGSTPLSARFMPRFWCACLLLLSGFLIMRALRERGALVKNGEFTKSTFSLKALLFKEYEVTLTFVAICTYIFFLKNLGFIIMTALYLFAQIIILSVPGKKNYAVAAAVAVFFAMSLDYLFVVWLNVLLPAGILGF